MMQSFVDMAIREQNARANFALSLQEIAGIDEITAYTLTSWYLRKKFAKLDRGIGRINVVHGGFLDRDAILRAVTLMTK